MTPRDFCYWLQGAFEIDKDFTKFSPAQAVILKRHLTMSFEAKYDESLVIVTDAGRTFGRWLEGVLDAVDTEAGIDAATTAKIRAKLDTMFVHAVNHSSPPDPEPFVEEPSIVYLPDENLRC